MKIYVPADGEMCNVHHDLDCCGRKFNRIDPHTRGIAEGLRMAGEIAIASGIYDNGIRTRDDIWKAILAKAKEVEEAKGEK